MLGEAVLMGVPEQYRNEFLAGTVYRVGALLFRKGQPGILAHIIETQGLGQASSLLMKANPIMGAANVGVSAIGQAVTVIQNEQIKAAISTLHSLQLGSIALSGVGIGVSIASAAILSYKINRVVDQVTALDSKLERLAKSIDELRAEFVAEDFDRLRTACERVDEAWRLHDPEPQWRSTAEELHGLQTRFARRVRRIIIETDEGSAIEPFLDAFALAGSTRVSSRLASGDTEAAEHAAQMFSREIVNITEPLGAASLLARQLGQENVLPGAASYALVVARLKPQAVTQAAALREREAMAASTPLMIKRLRHVGISGRTWLEKARNEVNEPLLFLAGDAAERA